MPLDPLPVRFADLAKSFNREQKLFTNSTKGEVVIGAAREFAQTARPGMVLSVSWSDNRAFGAAELVAWVARLPTQLAMAKDVPRLNLKELKPVEVRRSVGEALQVLGAGVQALISGVAVEDPKSTAAALLQVAFGTDAISVGLRKPLVDPKFPWPLPLPNWGQDLPDIGKLVLEGTLRDLISTFARCGQVAQDEANWLAKVVPIGRIEKLSASRACAGDMLTVSFADFGARPPAGYSDVLIAIPQAGGGCTHLSMSRLVHDLMGSGWADRGELSVVLPERVQTGCLGFFLLPQPIENGGVCAVGGLAGSAGMLQSVLGDTFGGPGVIVGQTVVDLATRIEMGRLRGLPCAVCQPDQANHLWAGPPVIHGFRVLEHGPIHPRGTVTLEWSVENADQIEIVVKSVAASENPHELPPVGLVTQSSGRLQLNVPCTRRWKAEYVLRASNANACLRAPLEATVSLTSGYSSYLVGVAKVDITDSRPNLGMAGFAYKLQKTSGVVDLPQYARAFVIEENSSAVDRKRLALVVADIWTCTQAVKAAALERINRCYGRQRYDDASLMIAGTHTHAGPGGYSQFALYNLTIGGFDAQVFDRIVNGIVAAVINADASRRRGRIYFNSGELSGCGAQRSREAARRNLEFNPADPATWTDREMTLLRFDEDLDQAPYHQPIGMLNWFAIHPTSLGMFNREISGDSKGWAANFVETDRGPIVAAFGNAAAGDVSGNLELDAQGGRTTFKPLARPGDNVAIAANKARMHQLARAQSDFAIALFDGAVEELTGALEGAHVFRDMSSVTITNGNGARTWPASLGISFGAGSSEDSIAYATVDLFGGLDIDANIVEGMTDVDSALGLAASVAAGAAEVGSAAALVTALLSGVAAGPALVVGAVVAVAALGDDRTRSFLAAQVAGMMFEDEMNTQKPVGPSPDDPSLIVEGHWKIPTPDRLSAAERAGQSPKPIMFAVGSGRLQLFPLGSGVSLGEIPMPLVPHINPIQLLRIGSLAIAAVPAEFTSRAGRRIKQNIQAAMGAATSHAVVSGYSNGYSGYVTTPQEYGAQHYEGASTLYGPNTLDAYIQDLVALAQALANGSAAPGGDPVFVPQLVFRLP